MAKFEQQYSEGSRELAQRQFGRATTSFKRALALASNPAMEAQGRMAKARLALVEGARLMRVRSYEAAAIQYQLALALSPADSLALAGLAEARFSAAYQSGMAALAHGSFNLARTQFRECLGYKPNDSRALAQMEKVDEIAGECDQFELAFRAANASIDSGAWDQADVQIKKAADIMLKAERMGFHAPAIFQPRPLLPAFSAFAIGDLDGALRLAQAANAKADPSRAAKFRRFLEGKRRSYYLHVWTPSLLGVYALALVGSLYVGLSRDLYSAKTAGA